VKEGFKMKHEIDFSNSDIVAKRNFVAGTISGNVQLEITKAGLVERLKTDRVVFYYSEEDQSAEGGIRAFFGEDTGQKVPAVFINTHKLGIGKYQIQSPFDESYEVSAIYGLGGSTGIGGDAFGEGEFVVDEFFYSPTSKSIRGSFDFNYTDRYGVAVNVKCMAFWAKNIG
jgi:hypothetical protein